MNNKILYAKLDTINSLILKTNKPFNLSSKIFIENMQINNIEVLNGDVTNTDNIKINFKNNFDFKNLGKIYLEEFKEKEIILGNLLNSKEFNDMFYTEENLGSIYSKDKTIFKVWAPTAKSVNLVIFKENKKEVISMILKDKGVYETILKGDNLNLEYLYEINFNDYKNLTVDPYSKSTTVNGKRSVVVDVSPNDTNFISNNTPIIYELSIRDISSFNDSGIKNKGKFIGLTEKGTKTSKGQITGLDYIKELGVTYVQLMPIYDFSELSVDEENQFEKYNWGYDPVNYNTPEGSYATDPYNPNTRILELQKLVQEFHNNNIGVIMDVVYNHVFDAKKHSFDLTVPNYFFRLDENGNYTNGTGVGNDIASEHKMVRRYIVDSLKYLMKTYKFDGFRFDLMGILDVDTMNEVYNELKNINPNLIILGEGWDMGTLPYNKKASQNNANQLNNIAFFNDDIRDSVKGSTFNNIGKGFVNGKENQEKMIIKNIKGGFGLRTYTKPSQLINYVEAHDNLTLYDQLKLTNPNDNDIIREKRHKLASTIIMLSNGIPFIHSGQEFLRTKNGDENSYKSPDSINKIDYDRALEYKENINYFKELIKIRKKYSLFNLNDYNIIEQTFEIIEDKNFIIAYKLKDNNPIYVFYNAKEENINLNIENGEYKLLISDQKANSEGLYDININNNIINIQALSSLVMIKIK